MKMVARENLAVVQNGGKNRRKEEQNGTREESNCKEIKIKKCVIDNQNILALFTERND